MGNNRKGWMFDASGAAFFSVALIAVLTLMMVSSWDTPVQTPPRDGTWYLWRSDGLWHSGNEPFVGAEAIYTGGRLYIREPAAKPDTSPRTNVWLQNTAKE